MFGPFTGGDPDARAQGSTSANTNSGELSNVDTGVEHRDTLDDWCYWWVDQKTV